MKAADVKRIIEHAISCEDGFPGGMSETSEAYETKLLGFDHEPGDDLVAIETVLGHAFLADTLREVFEAKKADPKTRLFWRKPPHFETQTDGNGTRSIMRARILITAKPKTHQVVPVPTELNPAAVELVPLPADGE